MFPSDGKVAVVGSRLFDDHRFLRETLNHYHSKYGISWIVSGGAAGADALAVHWSHDVQLFGYSVYPAQWEKYGKRAGFRRNLLIVESSDVVIAFPTPESKGTWHSVKLAKRFSMPHLVCYSPRYYMDRELPYEVNGVSP